MKSRNHERIRAECKVLVCRITQQKCNTELAGAILDTMILLPPIRRAKLPPGIEATDIEQSVNDEQ